MADQFPDSMNVFENQQELQIEYLDSSNFFKVLFQGKLYLCHKNGYQVSQGFDNIIESKAKGFFEVEVGTEFEKKLVRIKGLIDSTVKTIVKCKYKDVTINQEDSSIFCCSAIFNNKLNDDVYDYKGVLIYSNRKHIEFSSKTIHVLKTYLPHEMFIIENSILKEEHDFDGDSFYYFKKNKALLINKDNWYLIDIVTRKRMKVDKEDYFNKLFSLMSF